MEADYSKTYWRYAYEGVSACFWLLAFAGSAWVVVKRPLPAGVFYCLGAVALVLAMTRAAAAWRVWRHRASLTGRAVVQVSSADLQKKMAARPGQIWLGWGFEWGRDQMQRLYDLGKTDVERLKLPAVARFFHAYQPPRKGDPTIHGIEPEERDVYVAREDLAGHMLVVATTGAIKTRFLALLVAQAIRREPREAVIVLDPKGDRDLYELVRSECRAAGRDTDFFFFHPAFPDRSARLDPLRNWMRPSEIATRIAALIPGDAGANPFSAFGWRVVNLVAEGLVFVNERPTLTTLKRYVEGGPDRLLHQTIERHLQNQGIEYKEALRLYLAQSKKRKERKPSPETSQETVALTAYYKAEVQGRSPSPIVDGLISMYEHDREHMSKMLTNLVPVLTMLTAGELAGLLSPDRDDPHDERPIIDTAKVINAGQVLYVGLDSLSDATIGGAIGSILLADMTAVAGSRQTLGNLHNEINVFIDEANETVNEPFIQLLNKSRSANYRVTFFTQTVPDFIARTGSEAMARQILGNSNNLIAGRTKDKITAEFVTETLGNGVLRTTMQQQSTNAKDSSGLNFGGSYGERIIESTECLVEAATLSRLPDLEYFGVFAGNRIVKARIPVLVRQ
ncbi:MAG: conjugative transfer system coupling protein TraD [Gammaproteobacteria bacterium]